MSSPPSNKPLETAAAEWLQANREAIAASNAWVEANGLPLRDYRQF